MDFRCEFVPERTRRDRMEPDAAAAGGEGRCRYLLAQTSLSGITAEEGPNQTHNQTKVQRNKWSFEITAKLQPWTEEAQENRVLKLNRGGSAL